MLELIRRELFSLNIHAIVIPNADPHLSEYLPEHWSMIPWISGFTGSAGTLVITQANAGLWTDSRYFIQGAQELEGTGIDLYKQGLKDTLSIHDFLTNNLSQGATIAFNAKMWSKADLTKKKSQLEKYGLNVNVEHTPIENVWNHHNRPTLPTGEIFVHQGRFVGASVSDKLSDIRDHMNDQAVSSHLITSLDDIAWIYNLRGHDIEFNPVFLAYTIITKDQAFLFLDKRKLNDDAASHLQENGVHVQEYENIYQHLNLLDQEILVNTSDCNGFIVDQIPSKLLVQGNTISRLMKACKPTAELKHVEHAMIKDGVALAHAFWNLYQNIDRITEAEFASDIAEQRSKQEHYYGESFPAIVGYESNGAIVHYRPKEGTCALIRSKGLLLCDSGGQYFDGTTDITRTIAVGPLTEEQKTDYTHVLKGHIAVDQAIFPKGTTGGQLDTLARQFLWKSGKNYGHGTGHGVGYFLNVHEPPQGISPGGGSRTTTVLQKGMITSNEPGYYETSKYGIRIENLIVCEDADAVGFLQHRTLTLFPIDTTPIVMHLLTEDEIKWLNEYHHMVMERISPYLSGNIHAWFVDLCKKI